MTPIDVLRAATEKLTSGPLETWAVVPFGGIVSRGGLTVTWNLFGSEVSVDEDDVCQVHTSCDERACVQKLREHALSEMDQTAAKIRRRMMERIAKL